VAPRNIEEECHLQKQNEEIQINSHKFVATFRKVAPEMYDNTRMAPIIATIIYNYFLQTIIFYRAA